MKVLKNSEPLLNVGDKIRILITPDSRLMSLWKSMISTFYDPRIQPKAGDEYTVEEYAKYAKFIDPPYVLRLINGDKNKRMLFMEVTKESNFCVAPAISWIDALIKKKKIAIYEIIC